MSVEPLFWSSRYILAYIYVQELT